MEKTGLFSGEDGHGNFWSKEVVKGLAESSNILYDDSKLDFLYNSNKIEGSVFELLQLKILLYDNMVLGVHTFKDIRETINSLKAFDWVVSTLGDELTESSIVKIYQILKYGSCDSLVDSLSVDTRYDITSEESRRLTKTLMMWNLCKKNIEDIILC